MQILPRGIADNTTFKNSALLLFDGVAGASRVAATVTTWGHRRIFRDRPTVRVPHFRIARGERRLELPHHRSSRAVPEHPVWGR